MSWFRDDRELSQEEEAELARREEEERQREADFQRRLKFASDAGYRWPLGSDPAMPYVCPTCGASVTLSGVERHTAWHEAVLSKQALAAIIERVSSGGRYNA